eukprot:2400490-Pleurochrysis_carterae.AAC.1
MSATLIFDPMFVTAVARIKIIATRCHVGVVSRKSLAGAPKSLHGALRCRRMLQLTSNTGSGLCALASLRMRFDPAFNTEVAYKRCIFIHEVCKTNAV